jgi:hypothetical protein
LHELSADGDEVGCAVVERSLEHDAVGRSQDEGGHGCRIHPGRQLTPISLISDLSSEEPTQL